MVLRIARAGTTEAKRLPRAVPRIPPIKTKAIKNPKFPFPNTTTQYPLRAFFVKTNNPLDDFRNGIREGKGAYYWKNGYKYIGKYKGNKGNGQGVLYDRTGYEVFKGLFENDQFSDKMKK